MLASNQMLRAVRLPPPSPKAPHLPMAVWSGALPSLRAKRWVARYGRYANPTVAALAAKMVSLEGAEAAVAFASGTAATAAVVLSLLEPRRLRGRRNIGCNLRETGLARYYLLRPGARPGLLGITERSSVFAGFASMPSAAQPPMRLRGRKALAAMGGEKSLFAPVFPVVA